MPGSSWFCSSLSALSLLVLLLLLVLRRLRWPNLTCAWLRSTTNLGGGGGVGGWCVGGFLALTIALKESTSAWMALRWA